MAEVDCCLKSVLYFFVIPGLVVYIVARYVLGLNRAKIDALKCNYMTGLMHAQLHKEKKLLFGPLHDMTKKSKEGLTVTPTVLEIGSGSGRNFEFYPRGTEVTALDSTSEYVSYLKANLAKSQNDVRLVRFIESFAENMSSVESDSFDAVVCTLTMCSVKDPEAVLAEVKRVLKPGGTFFFLEHVAGHHGSFMRLMQHMLQKIGPHSHHHGGGHLHRETWRYLETAGFREVEYKHFTINTWVAFFARPGIYGTAVK